MLGQVPEDFVNYWDVTYPSRSITRKLSEAPIAIEIDYTITVKCRAGKI